jgi:hypothetical protein
MRRQTHWKLSRSAGGKKPAKAPAKGGKKKQALAKGGGGGAASAATAKKGAAAKGGSAGKAAASHGLPTGSLHDWPHLSTLATLAPLLHPIGLHTSALLALHQSKDCNTMGETIPADEDGGDSAAAGGIKSLELSPAAVHLLVTSLHAQLSSILHSSVRANPFAGGSSAATAAAGGEDGDGPAGGETALSASEAMTQGFPALCAFPSQLAALLELVDAGGHRDGDVSDDEDAPADVDAEDEYGVPTAGGGVNGSGGAAAAAARALERIPTRLQHSYAVPAVSAMLKILRLVFSSPQLSHPDSASRAQVALLLREFASAGASEGSAAATVAPSADGYVSDEAMGALAVGAFDYFEALAHSLPCGTTALDLVELLVTLAHVPHAKSAQRTQLVERSATMAQLPLGRAWPSRAPKPRGSQIGRLFHVALSHAAKPDAALEEWVTEVLPQFLEQVTATCDGARDPTFPPLAPCTPPYASLRARACNAGSTCPPSRPAPSRARACHPPRGSPSGRTGEGYAASQPLLSTKTIHLFYPPLTEQLIAVLKAQELPLDATAVGRLGERALSAAVDSVARVIQLFAGLLSPSKCLDTNSSFIAHILRMRCARERTHASKGVR